MSNSDSVSSQAGDSFYQLLEYWRDILRLHPPSRTNGVLRSRLIPILIAQFLPFLNCSKFTPSPCSFDHIRSEESDNPDQDWLANALCYAALAGSQPYILPGNPWPSLHIQSRPSAKLDVQSYQGVIKSPHWIRKPLFRAHGVDKAPDGRLRVHKPVSPVRAQRVSSTSVTVEIVEVPYSSLPGPFRHLRYSAQTQVSLRLRQ